jgi:hypothetical protein
MANCNLNLPCSQTAPSDPVTHKYVLEINTAVGDIGGAIVGNCETGVAISGNALNATGTAIGIGVSATTQSGNAGEFQSVRAIGVVGSAGLPDGGNPDFQGIGVQGNSTGGTAGLFTNSIAEDLTANNNPAPRRRDDWHRCRCICSHRQREQLCLRPRSYDGWHRLCRLLL